MIEMRSNVEVLYALHFSKYIIGLSRTTHELNYWEANGDKRVAREGLRSTVQKNTQHTRSFRSGLYIGLGITAFSGALILSNIRHPVSRWGLQLIWP
jgi:hypothetical protein